MATGQGGLIGSGMVPGGAIGQELSAVTRRAFIPELIVQIYQASPVLYMLMRGAQRAAGGVGNITVPVQGNAVTVPQYIDFGGSFNQPNDITGMLDAAANLSVAAVPIPFFGMEALVQATETVIPRLKVKMADAKQQMIQLWSNSLFNVTPATSLSLNSLASAYDDGTNFATYANINRTTAGQTFWKSTLNTSAGAVLTRSKMIFYILQATAKSGGERPDLVILSLADWTTLMQDFMTIEQFNTGPNSRYGKNDAVNAGFSCLMLGDTPIVADLYCPVGTAYFINTKYFALYLSEDAPFAFSGFYSAIPNLQIANIGVLIVAAQTLCTKPITGVQTTGITGGAAF